MKLSFEGPEKSMHVCERAAFPAQPVTSVTAQPVTPVSRAPRKTSCRACVAGRQCGPTISEAEGEERPMDFNMSDRQKEWLERVQAFMKAHVRPAVPIYDKQDAEGPRWKVIPILEDLKKKAKAEGLWNMFMPPSSHEDDEFHGAGLTNLEYPPLAAQMGRIGWGSAVVTWC